MTDFPYFNRREFECSCGCGYDTIDAETLDVLIDLREHFGQPCIITSAARCPCHNKAVGGADSSQHLYGRACDVVVKNFTPEQVFNYLEATYPDRYGLGLYGTFVHIDTRQQKARWGK